MPALSMSLDPDRTPRAWFSVSSVFAALGSVMLVVALVLGLHTRSFLADAARTNGVVISLDSSRSCDNNGCSTSNRPVVRYVVDGRTLTFEDSTSTSGGPQVGDTVKVAYRASDPSDARIVGGFFRNYLASVILGGLGLVFSFVGTVLLVVWARRRRKRLAPAADVTPSRFAPPQA
ncbi:DUF3592 domain-containing protein [Nocardioides montaniterrae]